jgi:hypothetical protein
MTMTAEIKAPKWYLTRLPLSLYTQAAAPQLISSDNYSVVPAAYPLVLPAHARRCTP